MRILSAFGILLMLTSCQMAPTTSYDSVLVKPKQGLPSVPVITEQTVIIDARPPFEYMLSHLNGSVNLRWEDFSQKTKPFSGLLNLDYFSLARRFATYGISPTTPVVIVGRGLRGEGEEGRLAWTLKFLGVQDVRFAGIENFSLPKTKEEAPPRKSEPIWKPDVDESIFVEQDQFLNRGNNVKVIDVRNEAEYLGKDSRSPYSKNAPELGAINIPWTDFFDNKGLVRQNISQRLEQVGISKLQVIYVIDNYGVRSAAVTLALRELGFVKASNFAGGYMELLGRK